MNEQEETVQLFRKENRKSPQEHFLPTETEKERILREENSIWLAENSLTSPRSRHGNSSIIFVWSTWKCFDYLRNEKFSNSQLFEEKNLESMDQNQIRNDWKRFQQRNFQWRTSKIFFSSIQWSSMFCLNGKKKEKLNPKIIRSVFNEN